MTTLSEAYEKAQNEDKDLDFAVDPGVDAGHGSMIMSPSQEELELFVDLEKDIPVTISSNTDTFIMVTLGEE